MGSLLNNALAIASLRGTNHDRDPGTPAQDAKTSRTSYELDIDIKFKMVNKSNCNQLASTSGTEDEDSSTSVDNQQTDDRGVYHDHDADDALIRKLSVRGYHIVPGNTWCQDLGMYIRNNHLIFGICCHHRLHPVKTKHRLVILLGSLAFGLSVTNAVYLYYLWGIAAKDYDDPIFSLSFGGDIVENVITDHAVVIDITHGMAVLWTVGAAAHSMFDYIMWHMIACTCIKRRSCRIAGWNVVVTIVMLLVAFTSFTSVARAYESREEMEEDIEPVGLGADFHYMKVYSIELALSLFVYTPLMQILLFSGIIGCGRLPILGGRPYEVWKVSKTNQHAKDVVTQEV